jgi:biopolymer transport protein TolR
MGMSAGGDSQYNSEINVTPMVDIMLVLLIIFMVITPLLQSGVSVMLPQNMRNPEEDAQINKESSVIIAITAENQFFVGRDEVRRGPDGRLTELQETIQRLMADKTEEAERIVYIKGDINTQYGNIVDVVDAIRNTGITRIGLVADRERGGAQQQPSPPAGG